MISQNIIAALIFFSTLNNGPSLSCTHIHTNKYAITCTTMMPNPLVD